MLLNATSSEFPTLQRKVRDVPVTMFFRIGRHASGEPYIGIRGVYDSSIAQEKGGRPFGVDALRAIQLVGDREPRSHEFSVQLRAFDAAKSGAKTGVASLIALASALLRKSVRGGLVVVGEVTLGGTIETVNNAVTLAELAIEKGAKSLLLPVGCRKQLFDLSDDMATKLDVEFYQDARDALLKALAD